MLAVHRILPEMTQFQTQTENTGGSFKNLLLWQRAVQLSLATYKLTASFPGSKRFGLTNQMHRASVSVASNIAEGCGRATKGESIQFLGNARGSNCESQTQLEIARGLNMGSELELKSTEDFFERGR